MKALRQKYPLKPARVKRVPLWPEIEVPEKRIATPAPPASRIAFHVQSGVEFVDPMYVTHLEAQSNYTAIHCINRRILVSKTLKEIATSFPPHFLRIHQTYLVNPNHVQTYLRHDQEVRLDNGMRLPVSRSGKVVMQEYLKKC